MPFGLANAPETYQNSLNRVLKKFKCKSCLFYIDYVLIYSNSIEEQIHHVDKICNTLAEVGVTPKLNNWTFFSYKVEYLVYIIFLGKLEVFNPHTFYLPHAKIPTTKNKLCSLLGL